MAPLGDSLGTFQDLSLTLSGELGLPNGSAGSAYPKGTSQAGRFFPLELFLGSAFQATIGLKNPDGTALNLANITVTSHCVDILGREFIRFQVLKNTDPTNGLLLLRASPLATNQVLSEGTYDRRASGPHYYSLLLNLPGGNKFALPPDRVFLRQTPENLVAINLGYDLPATPTPTPTNPPTVTPPGSQNNTPTLTPAQTSILYIQDQIWVDNQGNKVQMTIERQTDGKEFIKLTEVS